MPYVFKMPTLLKPAPPEGNFRARCTKVSTTNDEGVQLQSKNGDAQIRLTLELNTAYEISALLTLPSLDPNGEPLTKSGVALLRILGQVLKAFGNDAEENEQCEIGSKSFLGKECDVTIAEREYNGKRYKNVVRWAPKGSMDLEQKEVESDDIPF